MACYSIRPVKLEHFLNLPPTARRALLVAGDALAVLIAVWSAFAIRLGDWWPAMLQDVVWLFPLAVIILVLTFAAVGLYRPILRYADESLLYTIVLGVSAGILLMMAVWVFLRQGLVPRSSWLIGWLVLGLVAWWLLTAWSAIYRSTKVGAAGGADAAPADGD